MKKITTTAILLIICLVSIPTISHAQRAYIRNKIQRDVEKKVAAPHKERGAKAIDDITYENDKRFQNFKNAYPATLVYENQIMDKQGKLKETRKDVYLFGKRGEGMIVDLDNKNETRVLFDYIDKANYMVQVKDKTATKMPVINMRKKLVQQAEKMEAETNKCVAENTTKQISGYTCKKYVCTQDDGSYVEMWITNSKVIKLDTFFVYGLQVNTQAKNKDENFPQGFLVQYSHYNKKGILTTQRTLIKAEQKVDESYFDLSAYKIQNVVDFLH